MAKTAVEQWDTVANNNTDINSIDTDEGCAMAGMNNAVREIMAQIATARTNGELTYKAVVNFSANDTLVAAHRGDLVRGTAAITLGTTAAATLGAGWWCDVRAAGADVVIDPNGAETIDGSATLTIPDGASILIVCDGSNFFSTGAGFQQQSDVLDDLNTLGAATTDGEFIVATGAGAFAYESGATARTSLGLTIGTDVQAWDAQLDDLAGLAVTKGNVAVANGSNWVAVGVGTNDQVLTADSAQASGVKWADAGEWTILDDTTLSSSASWSVNALSSYRELEIRLYNVLPSAANANLAMRTDTGGADVGDSGAGDYKFTFYGVDNASNIFTSTVSSFNRLCLTGNSEANNQPSTTSPGVSGVVTLFEFNQAVKCQVIANVTFTGETSGHPIYVNCAGTREDATARDFVLIQFDAGNLASGRIVLRGR